MGIHGGKEPARRRQNGNRGKGKKGFKNQPNLDTNKRPEKTAGVAQSGKESKK